jgi:hypothetical protein
MKEQMGKKNQCADVEKKPTSYYILKRNPIARRLISRKCNPVGSPGVA